MRTTLAVGGAQSERTESRKPLSSVIHPSWAATGRKSTAAAAVTSQNRRDGATTSMSQGRPGRSFRKLTQPLPTQSSAPLVQTSYLSRIQSSRVVQWKTNTQTCSLCWTLKLVLGYNQFKCATEPVCLFVCTFLLHNPQVLCLHNPNLPFDCRAVK